MTEAGRYATICPHCGRLAVIVEMYDDDGYPYFDIICWCQQPLNFDER